MIQVNMINIRCELLYERTFYSEIITNNIQLFYKSSLRLHEPTSKQPRPTTTTNIKWSNEQPAVLSSSNELLSKPISTSSLSKPLPAATAIVLRQSISCHLRSPTISRSHLLSTTTDTTTTNSRLVIVLVFILIFAAN